LVAFAIVHPLDMTISATKPSAKCGLGFLTFDAQR
jgi:hypothetical protein